MGTGGFDLGDKIAKGAPEGVLVKIGCACHIETSRAQSLRDQSRIIGCSRQWGLAIFGIADDKSEPGLGGFRLRQSWH
jgi:hypothetical protein